MQGLVTLDFGNSHPHAGIFLRDGSRWNLVKVVPFSELALVTTALGITAHNTGLVLCEVRSREEELQPLLEQGYLLTRVKDYWRGDRFAGMPVQYAKTLGEDRLIEAFYAYKTLKTPTLIIDAGTFTTIDVVTEKALEGGFIVPGFRTYQRTFLQGEQLKDQGLEAIVSPELPQTTKEAMQNGYGAFGALANNLVEQFGIKKVLLTGGELSLWETFFDDSRPSLVVESVPHLLHSSLQYWFTTQIEPL